MGTSTCGTTCYLFSEPGVIQHCFLFVLEKDVLKRSRGGREEVTVCYWGSTKQGRVSGGLRGGAGDIRCSRNRNHSLKPDWSVSCTQKGAHNDNHCPEQRAVPIIFHSTHSLPLN